jgi:hypothetical protein
MTQQGIFRLLGEQENYVIFEAGSGLDLFLHSLGR